ncbi:hypothetical protein RCC89_08880 [Cytophagaceae bacterium ABcell3]|nr:hypothetical protein RCC89_08880 [Cytophagaceae bacterium ABcell3]
MAQPFNVPLNRHVHQAYEPFIHQDGEIKMHTSMRPFLQPQADTVLQEDPLYDFKPYKISRKRFFGRALDNFLNHHFIKVDTGDFYLTIDPLFDFQRGMDINRRQHTWVNTRGVWVRGAIGKNFSFESSFYENQAAFPHYLDSWVREYDVVPGQGQQKPFKGQFFDYNMAMGHISWTPSKYFNVRAGHGKHFIGDGYRSLLLSDNAFAYPYIQLTTTIWKFQYTNMFTEFLNLAEDRNVTHPKKYSAFHYLSTTIGKRLQVGLFENVMWHSGDSISRGFDVNYLNPVIMYRPLEFALGSEDRALIGINLKYLIGDRFWVYGQGVIDDLRLSEFRNPTHYRQKWGFQTGFVWLDAFKVENLRLQSEYNQVSPYTYTHRLASQTYTHYNQALAHPLGANFRENVNFISYRYKRFFIEGRYSYAMFGADTGNVAWGQNVLLTESDINIRSNQIPGEIGQGVTTHLHWFGCLFAYIINPHTNMRFEVNFMRRYQHSELGQQGMNFVSVGLSTNLRNKYYDF